MRICLRFGVFKRIVLIRLCDPLPKNIHERKDGKNTKTEKIELKGVAALMPLRFLKEMPRSFGSVN